jgi:hypothetical protein
MKIIGAPQGARIFWHVGAAIAYDVEAKQRCALNDFGVGESVGSNQTEAGKDFTGQIEFEAAAPLFADLHAELRGNRISRGHILFGQVIAR